MPWGAKRAIEALAELAPRTALVRGKDGSTHEVPVEDLAIGDVIVVKPDERVAADGFVIKGTSAINQPRHGRACPLIKSRGRGRRCCARKRRSPRCRVSRLRRYDQWQRASRNRSHTTSSESTLAKVVKMVSEAETQKSPTQRFTDKFERFRPGCSRAGLHPSVRMGGGR
jgi:Cd2+/Zn2+-exporting ATPase